MIFKNTFILYNMNNHPPPIDTIKQVLVSSFYTALTRREYSLRCSAFSHKSQNQFIERLQLTAHTYIDTYIYTLTPVRAHALAHTHSHTHTHTHTHQRKTDQTSCFELCSNFPPAAFLGVRGERVGGGVGGGGGGGGGTD